MTEANSASSSAGESVDIGKRMATWERAIGAARRTGGHALRYPAILVLCAFGFSCEKEADPTGVATKPAATASAEYVVHSAPTTVAGADRVVCVECPEDEAAVILVAELTIPELFTRKRYRFPIKRIFTHDVFGAVRVRDGHYYSECADGIGEDGRGCGYMGSVNVVDGRRSMLTIRLSFSWTAPDGTRGTLSETLPLTLGADGERWELGNGAILTARYLDVKRSRELTETRPAAHQTKPSDR